MKYTLFPSGPRGSSMIGPLPIYELLVQCSDEESDQNRRYTKGAEASDVTWRAWKTALPAYSHAIFQGGVKAENVVEITGFSIDQDDVQPGIVEAIARENGLAFYRWDTVSKQVGKKQYAYRYLIPFAAPLEISPDSYKQLWANLSALFGGTNDPATKNADRKMYLPCYVNGVAPNLIYQPGELMDVSRIPLAKDADILSTDEAKPPELVSLPQGQLTSALENVIKKTRNNIDKLALQSLKKGQEFAVSGQRHAAILRLTYILVSELPTVATECIASLFRSSLQSMTTKHTLADVERAIDGAREKFVSQSSRRKAVLIRAARGDGHAHEYTYNERKAMAEIQGCSVSDLNHRVLIQRGTEIYVLTHRTGYEGPYIKQASAFTPQLLAPWGIDEAATARALELHGLLAKNVVFSLGLGSSVHAIDMGTLRIASARPEVTFTAKEHKDVAAWLESFDDPALIDWVACAPDPDKAVCGLGVYGPPAVGKSLLAVGLARLWGNGTPANPHEVFETNYNASLAKNAILHIDEYTPNKFGQPVSAILRQIIGTYNQALSVKHAQPISLEGYTRVILTGNDQLPLALNEDLGRQSQEALAERILVIEATEHVAETLAKYDANLFKLHKIAEHALWLNQNREIKKAKRFWVQGNLGNMLNQLLITNKPTTNIGEWLIRFVLDMTEPHMTLNSDAGDYWRCPKGQLAVSVELLNRCWGVYRDARYKPSTSSIREQLSVLSLTGKTDKYLSVSGERKRMYRLDVGKLAVLAQEIGLAEPDELLVALASRESK